VVVDLEIVPARVRDDAPVEDMKFPEGPAVKARLLEGILEQVGLADLYVAKARPQAADAKAGRDAAYIFVVADPPDGASRAVDIGEFHYFYLLDPQPVHRPHDQLVLVRPVHGFARDLQVDRQSPPGRCKAFFDLRCE